MSPQLIKLVFAFALLGGLYVGHLYLVDKAVDAKELSMKKEFHKQMLESIEDATKTEDKLRNSLNKKIQERDKQIANITAEHARLNRMLNTRLSREDNSKTPGSEPSCTGSQLYREDGEFLAGEASRAEKLIEDRDFYYQVYLQTKNELEELRNATHQSR